MTLTSWSVAFLLVTMQRMALSTCLHLCEVVNTKADVAKLMPILPCLSKCLASEDQTIVNRACQCFGRVIEGLSPAAPRRHATSSTPLAPSEQRDRKPPLPPKSTEDDSVIWKAGFAKEMAESGLLQEWLRMISGRQNTTVEEVINPLEAI